MLKTQITRTSLGFLLSFSLLMAIGACGDDKGGNNNGPDAASPADAAPNFDAAPQPVVYRQIEQLARPGIAEALLLTPAFLEGYNAGAPTFTGFEPATVDAVVAEAKVVLQALYLGTCLVNGALIAEGVIADETEGAKPAGITCHASGGALFDENALDGVTLTAASTTAAGAYADQVVGAFLPDVMRIDTGVASGYLSLCGGAAGTPLLCGGRNLEDDTIDITYNYLLNGAATPTNQTQNQFGALTGDGVVFTLDDTVDRGNTVISTDAAGNPSQGHPLTSATFPYSAPPQ